MAKVSGADNQALHDRSGQVSIKWNPLIGFLYEAMRDGYLAPGVAEKITRNNTSVIAERDRTSVAFCNGWLARYAEDIANRLTKPGELNEKHVGHQCGSGSVGLDV